MVWLFFFSNGCLDNFGLYVIVILILFSIPIIRQLRMEYDINYRNKMLKQQEEYQKTLKDIEESKQIFIELFTIDLKNYFLSINFFKKLYLFTIKYFNILKPFFDKIIDKLKEILKDIFKK